MHSSLEQKSAQKASLLAREVASKTASEAIHAGMVRAIVSTLFTKIDTTDSDSTRKRRHAYRLFTKVLNPPECIEALDEADAIIAISKPTHLGQPGHLIFLMFQVICNELGESDPHLTHDGYTFDEKGLELLRNNLFNTTVKEGALRIERAVKFIEQQQKTKTVVLAKFNKELHQINQRPIYEIIIHYCTKHLEKKKQQGQLTPQDIFYKYLIERLTKELSLKDSTFYEEMIAVYLKPIKEIRMEEVTLPLTHKDDACVGDHAPTALKQAVNKTQKELMNMLKARYKKKLPRELLSTLEKATFKYLEKESACALSIPTNPDDKAGNTDLFYRKEIPMGPAWGKEYGTAICYYSPEHLAGALYEHMMDACYGDKGYDSESSESSESSGSSGRTNDHLTALLKPATKNLFIKTILEAIDSDNLKVIEIFSGLLFERLQQSNRRFEATEAEAKEIYKILSVLFSSSPSSTSDETPLSTLTPPSTSLPTHSPDAIWDQRQWDQSQWDQSQIDTLFEQLTAHRLNKEAKKVEVERQVPQMKKIKELLESFLCVSIVNSTTQFTCEITEKEEECPCR